MGTVPLSLRYTVLPVGYVVGGALALISYIQKRYNDLGDELYLKARVEKVLVENDKAVGIRLVDGTEHWDDIVIFAADGHTTIFNMLDGKYVEGLTFPLEKPITIAGKEHKTLTVQIYNFYMAGQWVFPGGGLPTAVMSGNHPIQLICSKDKKKFMTTMRSFRYKLYIN